MLEWTTTPSSPPRIRSWGTAPPWKWKVAPGLQPDQEVAVAAVDEQHALARLERGSLAIHGTALPYRFP